MEIKLCVLENIRRKKLGGNFRGPKNAVGNLRFWEICEILHDLQSCNLTIFFPRKLSDISLIKSSSKVVKM